MAKFFIQPFAIGGDKATIPENFQPDGSVSYNQGFTIDYELDYPVNPNAKPVPRNQTNQYLFDITDAIRQYQTLGFNDFITVADNGGVPFSYEANAICRYDSGGGFNLYQSLENANNTLPDDTTKWRLLSGGFVARNTGATIPASELNTEQIIDISGGSHTFTLPPTADWSNGDKLKFFIDSTNANESFRMRIKGDAAELISSYNDHNFYFKNSWVIIKKQPSGLVIDDYYDARSIVFKAFFANGQSQAASGTAIYPSTSLNSASIYNSANGIALLRIRGQWQFSATLYQNASVASADCTINAEVNGAIAEGGVAKNAFSSGPISPSCALTFEHETTVDTDQVKIVIGASGIIYNRRWFGLNSPGVYGNSIKKIYLINLF